jgi:hypothetical protein
MTKKQPNSLETDQNFPALAVNKGPNMQLSEQQSVLYRVLLEEDPMLANMYVGTLIVLNHNENPDHLALAAHGVRELMEKLPLFVNVPIKAQSENLKSEVRNLENIWLITLQKSQSCNNQTWEGEIDYPLQKLLKKLHSFFEWFTEHHPRRKAEVAETLRRLDISGRTLPNPLEDLNIKTWFEIRDFFQSVAHHQKPTTTDDEFGQWLEALEIFLLDRLHPRTFTDINKIDEIIREGESDA